ncbi:MAG: hypothetical protein ACHQ6T_05895 [Myxococcota bacterium]
MRRRLLVTLALAALVSASACGCGERTASANRAGDSAPADASPLPASATDGDGALPPAALGSLPADIPIPDGLHPTSVESAEPGSLVAIFTGELEPDDAARLFAEGLRGQGWSIDDSRTRGDDLGLFASKKQRIASVVITRLSGKLHVELGVWTPRE